ncbi:hypothetical protein [Mesonia sp. K7]|uniref:hypothetical protein n=1 Tax=Mesonia sp. K7 TaxID=2218606 RepID=UPI0018F1643C|nr:hypothetical protein [Mesonia sp. K7]
MILPWRFLVPKGYLAVTFFPFIFLKNHLLKNDKILVNHEKIHLRQQLELLVIPFFILYFAHFIYLWLKHKNWQIAYRNIIFEREAYQKDNDLEYLKNRPFWNFLKF